MNFTTVPGYPALSTVLHWLTPMISYNFMNLHFVLSFLGYIIHSILTLYIFDHTNNHFSFLEQDALNALKSWLFSQVLLG